MSEEKKQNPGEDLLLWVDEKDHVIGYGEKLDTHVRRQCHRAFSVFLFDWSREKMLLQRRASGKYHSGGLWSNACCSHPRKGESMEEALNGRLKTELGLSCSVRIKEADECRIVLPEEHTIYRAGSFHYCAHFKGLSENEMDHVFLYSRGEGIGKGGGFLESDFTWNPEEIQDTKWIAIEEIEEWYSRSPQDFSAWFKQAYDLAYKVLCRQKQSFS